jgi:CDP-diacylglycerol--glycerol-3-phosphate 3-phosphatidyltransferase
MTIRTLQQLSVLASLRIRWAVLTFIAALLLASGYAVLQAGWQPDYALHWLFLAGAGTMALSWALWSVLPDNHREGEGELLPALGPGNLLTLWRGLLTAALVGFLFLPRPPGLLAWIPGGLYTAAATADVFDGYLARRSNHATRLGELLDLRLDGFGVLVAALLIVQYGQVPAWYLLVGLSRYLFLAWIGLRRRLGKAVFDLPPSPARRPLAGAQMGFIAVILWPLFSPPGTHLAAALFALPFLAGFARDGLAVSGVRLPSWRRPDQDQIQAGDLLERDRPGGPGQVVRRWLPVFLRTVALLTLGASLARLAGEAAVQPIPQAQLLPIYAFYLAGGLMLALGAAGRVGALAALFAIGLQQAVTGLSFPDWGVIVSGSALFFLGTGPFSVWTPENRIIERRLGER